MPDVTLCYLINVAIFVFFSYLTPRISCALKARCDLNCVESAVKLHQPDAASVQAVSVMYN